MPRPTEGRTISTAGGGTSLSTTLALMEIAKNGKTMGPGTLTLTPRNGAGGALVVKFAVTPRLSILFSNDALAALPVDLSPNAQDGSGSTTCAVGGLVPAPVGYIYIGAPAEFRCIQVGTPGTANATASVMTAEYWNGTAWTALTITDGTTSGGATFAVAGNITFTVPTDWTPARLVDIASHQAAAAPIDNNAFEGSQDVTSVISMMKFTFLWIRLKVSVAIDAGTTVPSMVAMARSTAYSEMLLTEEVAISDPNFNSLPTGIGAVEALVDQGTASLIVEMRGEFTTS